MSSQTPRFGLLTFTEGESGWSHTDTVEFLDENAVGRGTLANRPSSGDYDNQFYFATDEHILYRWDNGTTSWVQEAIRDHATRHSSGGADEVNAANLATSGVSGEFLSATSGWATPAYSVDASETTDGSDLTNYSFDGSASNVTAVDITGSGVLIGGVAITSEFADNSGTSLSFDITVDGGTQYSIGGGGSYGGGDDSKRNVASCPSVRFSSSLQVIVSHSEDEVGGNVVVKQ